MAKQKIELVIFDCDGVLIDSEVISGKVLISLLTERGVNIDFAYVQQNFIGRSFQKVAVEIGESFGLELSYDFEVTYRAKLLKAFETELKPTDGVAKILALLNVNICVATSSSPERVGKSLQITRLAKYFGDNVYTASLVENGKPAPDLFLLAAKNMGVEPANCLVVEDSIPGMQAAINANMPVYHYAGGSHLHGVDLPIKPHEKPNGMFAVWEDFERLLPQLFVK